MVQTEAAELQVADALLQEGRFDDAIAGLNRVIAVHCSLPLLLKRASAHDAHGHEGDGGRPAFRAAADDHARVLDRLKQGERLPQASDIEAYEVPRYLGSSLFEAGDYRRALALSQAMGWTPEDDPHLSLYLLGVGRWEEATKAVRWAGTLYEALATAFGGVPTAQAALREEATLAPKNAWWLGILFDEWVLLEDPWRDPIAPSLRDLAQGERDASLVWARAAALAAEGEHFWAASLRAQGSFLLGLRAEQRGDRAEAAHHYTNCVEVGFGSLEEVAWASGRLAQWADD